jgi:hypothetical protein
VLSERRYNIVSMSQKGIGAYYQLKASNAGQNGTTMIVAAGGGGPESVLIEFLVKPFERQF